MKELKQQLETHLINTPIYFIDAEDATSQIRTDELKRNNSHIFEAKDIYTGTFIPLTAVIHEE